MMSETESENREEPQREDEFDSWQPTMFVGSLMLSTLTIAMIILFFFHTK